MHEPIRTELPELLKAREAAAFLRRSLVTLYRWRDKEGLPYYRLGNECLYRRDELLAFLESKRNNDASK